MAKKKDLLKDKLNALNPSIPTNTRGEAAKETRAGEPSPDLKSKRKETAAQTKPRSGKKPATVKPFPEMKPETAAAPKAAPGPLPRNENTNLFEGPFLFSALLRENLIALNRMYDMIFTMNSSFFDSYTRCAGICCENFRKGCFFHPYSPRGKWPFTF